MTKACRGPIPRDLFASEPSPVQRAALSQWFTPMWLARKLAGWCPRSARVLEPSCGSGNIVAALLERGFDPRDITAIEIDGMWARFARERFSGFVRVVCSDFTRMPASEDVVDVCVSNPPFEHNAHMHSVLHMLRHAPLVIGIFPASFEFTKRRESELWAPHAKVVRRARLPARVDFGGPMSGMLDSVALKIVRRLRPREPGEVEEVIEEVWNEGEVS